MDNYFLKADKWCMRIIIFESRHIILDSSPIQFYEHYILESPPIHFMNITCYVCEPDDNTYYSSRTTMNEYIVYSNLNITL
jgi:hypothetical protein